MGSPRAQTQSNSRSYIDMLSSFSFMQSKSPAQKTAEKYIERCHAYNIGKILNIILLINDPEILEFFLIGIGEKDIAKMGLPYARNTQIKNPLEECILSDFDTTKPMLAILLKHGLDPNYHFIINVGEEKFIQLPPLLHAILFKSKSAIRLLMLYGATIKNISRENLLPSERRIDLTPELKVFYNIVAKDFLDLRKIEAEAKDLESKCHYELAHLHYEQAKDYYLSFYRTCAKECESDKAISDLQIFYLRLALVPYIKSLECKAKSPKKPNATLEEIENLQFDLLKSHLEFKSLSPDAFKNEFFKKEFDVLLEAWGRLSESLEDMRKEFITLQKKPVFKITALQDNSESSNGHSSDSNPYLSVSSNSRPDSSNSNKDDSSSSSVSSTSSISSTSNDSGSSDSDSEDSNEYTPLTQMRRRVI